eukprot:TRINITY_DN24154_c0_g1_i1.p1 TRINITY_DN24154_c0_g1~~TRINITY_DN24154_c0_g1_i1.p1  ORF type:complete len:345 (+),score=87.84 TRINITY_DN24154_c0_g1_i1:77-1036(+)
MAQPSMSLPDDVAAEVNTMLLSESTRCPLLYIVAEVMGAVVAKGDNKAQQAGKPQPTPYDSAERADISILDYVRRWVRHLHCGSVVPVAAVLYVDRICLRTGIVASSINIHRLLLAALTVASKWHADRPYYMKCYAQVGGVKTAELLRLERQLLNDLDWNLNITPEELSVYTTMFRRHYKWADAVHFLFQGSGKDKPLTLPPLPSSASCTAPVSSGPRRATAPAVPSRPLVGGEGAARALRRVTAPATSVAPSGHNERPAPSEQHNAAVAVALAPLKPTPPPSRERGQQSTRNRQYEQQELSDDLAPATRLPPTRACPP